jgi:hypothetical protein
MKADQPVAEARTMKKAVFALLPALVALTLTGCWTPPNANVQPKGEPRLIQSGVSADVYKVRVTVKTIDAGNQTIGIELSDGTAINCTLSPQVKTSRPLQIGDQIKVTLAEKLAVYVLKDGRLPGPGGTDEAIPFIARVQTVDPSYRLLKLQYLNGQTLGLKTDLDAKLLEMQPGDAVVLQNAEATEIHIEKN